MHLVPIIQLGNRNRENRSPPNSEETVAFAWMRSLQDTFKFQERTWGREDSQQNVSAKIIWFQSSNLEIEIARTGRHQILRRQSHSLECGVYKTLSNSKNGHEVAKIANKMCRQNAWSKSHNSIRTSAWWWIRCTFLGTTIQHLASLLPIQCFSCTLVIDFPSPFIAAVIW